MINNIHRSFVMTVALLVLLCSACWAQSALSGSAALSPDEIRSVLDQAAAQTGQPGIGLRVNSKAVGAVTMFKANGERVTFPVTLLRRGLNQVQRIVFQDGRLLRQGTDGIQMWSSAGGFTSSPSSAAQIH